MLKEVTQFTFAVTPNTFQNLFWYYFGVICCHNRNQQFAVFILLPSKLKSTTFVFLELDYFRFVVLVFTLNIRLRVPSATQTYGCTHTHTHMPKKKYGFSKNIYYLDRTNSEQKYSFTSMNQMKFYLTWIQRWLSLLKTWLP